jgi:hypothetical protein
MNAKQAIADTANLAKRLLQDDKRKDDAASLFVSSSLRLRLWPSERRDPSAKQGST